MKYLGNCPFCNDGKIIVKNTILQGKKGKIYSCSNAKWEFDNDIFKLTDDSTCSYRIFSNTLLRYNKRNLGEYEIKELLQEGQVEVVLHARNPYYEKLEDGSSKRKYKEYKKYIIPNLDYGIEVLWED